MPEVSVVGRERRLELAGMRSLISRSLRRLDRMLGERSYECFEPDASDIFLVSFPRSGSTWVRVMLAELIFGESGSSIAELNKFIPDLHAFVRADDVRTTDNLHFVKSHWPYRLNTDTERYQRVVYLVRDPRDVVLSHYRYACSFDQYSLEINEFIADWLNGRIWPCSWQEHVNSWTDGSLQTRGLDLHTIRYEDLVASPQQVLSDLASLLGLRTTLEEIKRSVCTASVASMRTRAQRGIRCHLTGTEHSFIGPASSEQWRTGLMPQQCGLITEYCAIPMARLGYLG